MKRCWLLLPVLTLVIIPYSCDDKTSPTDDGISRPAVVEYYIPPVMLFDNNRYLYDEDVKVTEDDIVGFLGYWINHTDLEKWKEYDDDETIVYVVSEGETIIYKDTCPAYDNRYKLYWTTEENQIALAPSPYGIWDMMVYVKVPSE